MFETTFHIFIKADTMKHNEDPFMAVSVKIRSI